MNVYHPKIVNGVLPYSRVLSGDIVYNPLGGNNKTYRVTWLYRKSIYLVPQVITTSRSLSVTPFSLGVGNKLKLQPIRAIEDITIATELNNDHVEDCLQSTAILRRCAVSCEGCEGCVVFRASEVIYLDSFKIRHTIIFKHLAKLCISLSVTSINYTF